MAHSPKLSSGRHSEHTFCIPMISAGVTCGAFSSKSNPAATGILRQAGPRTTFDIPDLRFCLQSFREPQPQCTHGGRPPPRPAVQDLGTLTIHPARIELATFSVLG